MSYARIALVLTLAVIGGPALSPCRCGEADRPDVARYLKLLDDDNPQVRKQALAVLERLGPAARPALPVLTRLLKAADPAVRAWAATNLARLGAEARPAINDLVSSLNDADPDARAAKAEALDIIDDQVRLADLLTRMRNPRLGKAERDAACKEMVAAFPHLPTVRPALESALADAVVKAAAAEGLEALDAALSAAPKPVARFTQGHKGQVLALAFSPYGKKLYTGGQERVLRAWDAVTGKLLVEMKGHTHSISSLAVSPDGRRVASAGLDGTVRVWDALGGKELTKITGDFDGVWAVAFSPDGSRLALGAERKEKSNLIQLHDASTGKKLLSLESESYYLRKITFSPDGRRVAAVFSFPGEPSRPELKIWDAADGKLLLSRDGTQGPATVIYTPDGARMILGTRDVAVLNAADGKHLKSYNAKHQMVSDAVLSPNGRLFAFTTNEKPAEGKCGVVVGSADTGKELLLLPGHGASFFGGGHLNRLAVSRDGSLLAVGSDQPFSSEVKVWDLSTLTRRPVPPNEKPGPIQKKSPSKSR